MIFYIWLKSISAAATAAFVLLSPPPCQPASPGYFFSLGAEKFSRPAWPDANLLHALEESPAEFGRLWLGPVQREKGCMDERAGSGHVMGCIGVAGRRGLGQDGA